MLQVKTLLFFSKQNSSDLADFSSKLLRTKTKPTVINQTVGTVSLEKE